MQATARGEIALIGEPRAFEGSRPVVLMVHGALRHAGVLTDWAPAVAGFADAVFGELPGHGRSPPHAAASVASFAESLTEAIAAALPGRRVVIVGESLGGLVAIAMAGLDAPAVDAVVAVDPPFTTAKQWQLYETFQRALAQEPDDAFRRMLGHDVFGISPGAQEERVYYPLLDAARTPVHIITGDLKLQPRRAFSGVACLVDEVDLFVLERLYADKARVHVLPGAGHLVLNDQRAACLNLIRSLVEPSRDEVLVS